jgi:predicted ATPase
MPITSIRLHNFRCFRDSGEIAIRPITVVFGRNNAGKSSILHSLSLLRQTLDRPEYGERLNMRGPLYPAGTYADIVHQHQSRENITMEFDVKDRVGRLAAIEMEFSSDEPQPPRLVRFRVKPRTAASLEIRRGRGRGGPFELHIDGEPLGGERDANFRFPINQFLPLIGEEPPRRGRPSSRRDEARRIARAMIGEFEQALTRLRAVGAFREAPVRRYDYQGRPPESVDLSGQHVVHALIEDSMRRGKHRGKLLPALNRWLKNVGRVRLMPLRRITPTARLYELRLKDLDSGRWANFADVGFGIGQAFPVLVEGLRTPADGLFIVQEPEIHLHPDAQLAMADYLVDLSSVGRTVIVETHSEALLLRIRRAVVGNRDRSGYRRRLQPHNVSIVHVASVGDGTSTVKPLKIDELGQIQGWPAGFMEEATRERLELLGTMAARSGED